MENYPREEDPGSCIVNGIVVAFTVLLGIPTVALLAWCVWTALRLSWQ